MVFGLAENAEDFPDCPVRAERLQEALARYKGAKETAATAEGAVAKAYEEKADAVQALTDHMKSVVRYAEIVVGQDEGKLKNIGWIDKLRTLEPGTFCPRIRLAQKRLGMKPSPRRRRTSDWTA
jgi:hypothetical protein